jgi:hypothetical protein
MITGTKYPSNPHDAGAYGNQLPATVPGSLPVALLLEENS